jgi:hypothetical protein
MFVVVITVGYRPKRFSIRDRNSYRKSIRTFNDNSNRHREDFKLDH